ncbi:MAG TPA: exonuclease domain-containing protein [Pyrinomonadaceae bacterium]|nr:exonuclease domain-containing protein [Pyrinomonadaceae bacterium]
MEIPRNLISDSPLLQETFKLLNDNGGRVSFAEIADVVFRLRHAGDELAASLVSDLVRNDSRFRLDQTHLVISEDSLEYRPLNEITFVVLDVEAIIARSRPAKIIELGAYRIYDGQITAEFQTLLNPEVPLPRFIAALTGISDQMLEPAPKFAEIAGAWLDFAGDAVLVAHNSDFDLPLLNREIERVFSGHRMRNPELCTVNLARRLLRNSGGHNLDALAEHFGFEITDRHRAAGDARATARVLLCLLAQLQEHGVRTLAEARTFSAAIRPSQELDLQLALDV